MGIQFYSEDTGKFYKLKETKDWPTIEISGIHMHRVGEINPKEDSFNKVRCLRPKGRVLDTCMGLGYTTIIMAKMKKVDEVVTVEKDHNVIIIAKNNPFSSELWKNPKIRIFEGDIFEVIDELGKFDNILHDPPRFSFAPELYSLDFYKKLNKSLRLWGRLFHYTGRPGSKSGKSFVKGVKNRLRLAGFRILKDCEKSLGILAVKSRELSKDDTDHI